MKKSKFTEAQFAAALTECESGTPIGQVARKFGVSEQTLYVWKKKYGARHRRHSQAATARGGKLEAEAAGG
jgi:transposase-like protein